MSKSTTVPGHNTASQMYFHSVWSTALQKGEVKSNRFKRCSKKKYFENKKVLNTNKDEVIIAATKLLYKRWINCNKEFLEVKVEGAKDEEYLDALQQLDKEDNKMASILYQEEGGLYRK
jgi:hypothetical protein